MQRIVMLALACLASAVHAAPVQWIGVARTTVAREDQCPESIREQKTFVSVDEMRAHHKAFYAREDITDENVVTVTSGEVAIIFSFLGRTELARKCPGFMRYRVMKGKSVSIIEAEMKRRYLNNKKEYLSEPSATAIIDPSK